MSVKRVKSASISVVEIKNTCLGPPSPMSLFVFMDLDYMRRESGRFSFWKSDKGSLMSDFFVNIRYLSPERLEQLIWTS